MLRVTLFTVLLFLVAPAATAGLLRDRCPRPQDKPVLVALSPPAEDRETVIFVHGFRGGPEHFNAIAQRLQTTSLYQLSALSYDDTHRRDSVNARDFAEVLRQLPASAHRLTIIAHSMGGIIAKGAINELTYGAEGGIQRFAHVRLIMIDTPWHGFIGTSEHGVAGWVTRHLIFPFMPDGMEEMNEYSEFLATLNTRPLASNVSMRLYFARDRSLVQDYTNGSIRALPGLLAEHFNRGSEIRGSIKLTHFWQALLLSDRYAELERDLLARAPRLNARFVFLKLSQYYPKFAGDHTGVLSEHPGDFSLLDELSRTLESREGQPY